MLKKILVVEDNVDQREPVADFLSYRRYKIFEAENGSQGLEIAFKEQPEVILLDMMLPDISGIEVCRQIRANPELSGCIIIFTTALSEDQFVNDALQAGADFYMIKPFGLTELADTIEGLIAGIETLKEKRIYKPGIDLLRLLKKEPAKGRSRNRCLISSI